ncbi:MAG: hypothetical protein ACK56F_23295, partial [bacterium]
MRTCNVWASVLIHSLAAWSLLGLLGLALTTYFLLLLRPLKHTKVALGARPSFHGLVPEQLWSAHGPQTQERAHSPS